MKTTRELKLVLSDTSVKIRTNLTLGSNLSYTVMDTAMLSNNTILDDTAVSVTNHIGLEDLDGNPLTLVKIITAMHNNLKLMLWYDTVEQDMFLTPDLNGYKDMTYLTGNVLQISGYSIMFGRDTTLRLPAPKLTASPKGVVVTIPSYADAEKKSSYFEKMVTNTLNYHSVSIRGRLLIDLGTPSSFFSNLDFIAPIEISGYNSVFEYTTISTGNKKMEDIGHIVISVPV